MLKKLIHIAGKFVLRNNAKLERKVGYRLELKDIGDDWILLAILELAPHIKAVLYAGGVKPNKEHIARFRDLVMHHIKIKLV